MVHMYMCLQAQIGHEVTMVDAVLPYHLLSKQSQCFHRLVSTVISFTVYTSCFCLGKLLRFFWLRTFSDTVYRSYVRTFYVFQGYAVQQVQAKRLFAIFCNVFRNNSSLPLSPWYPSTQQLGKIFKFTVTLPSIRFN